MIGRLSILALIALLTHKKTVKDIVSSSLEKSQEKYALPSCTPIITFSETHIAYYSSVNPSRIYTNSRENNKKENTYDYTSFKTVSSTISPKSEPMQTRI